MPEPTGPAKVTVEAGGRRLVVSSLDKVLYPATETTKGEVLHYYARIAPVPVSYTHLDVYKRQDAGCDLRASGQPALRAAVFFAAVFLAAAGLAGAGLVGAALVGAGLVGADDDPVPGSPRAALALSTLLLSLIHL